MEYTILLIQQWCFANAYVIRKKERFAMSIFDKVKKILTETPPINTTTPEPEPKKEAAGEEEYEIVEKEILPEKMICPDCGGITLVGLEFCDKCGGELISRDN